MANQLLTTDLIADRALMRLSEKLAFTRTIPRTYDSSFKGNPAVGDRIRVVIPQNAVIRHGRVATPAPLLTNTAEVAIVDQTGFDLQYTSAELALDINEFERRFLSQQIADLAVSIEANIQRLAYEATPNQVGDATGPWTALGYANLAKKLIEDNGGGQDTKKMLINNTAETTLIPSLSGLFNSQQQIKVQYEEGQMGRAAGFDWNSSSVMPLHTNGAGTGFLVQGAGQTGSTITVDTGTGILTKGTVITFAGVVAAHRQTKQSLGYLRQFVVTEDKPAGAGPLSIFPALETTGANQNVLAAPADNAPITVNQAASSTFGISLAYRPEAFTMVTVDLPELNGQKTSRRAFDGISMRVTEGSSIVNDMNLTRFDIVYGFGALRPELAVRVVNQNELPTF